MGMGRGWLASLLKTNLESILLFRKITPLKISSFFKNFKTVASKISRMILLHVHNSQTTSFPHHHSSMELNKFLC